MDRRQVIAAGVGVISSKFAAGQVGASEAPDPISSSVLKKRITPTWKSRNRTVGDSLAVHRDFHRLIEQHYALMRRDRLSRAVKNLSDLELSHLAQFYEASRTFAGNSNATLLDLFAIKLEANALARISRHFGFEPTYSAIHRQAPQKSQGFLESSDPNSPSPRALKMNLGVGGSLEGLQSYKAHLHGTDPAEYRLRNTKMIKTGGAGQFLNYTPYEIYLSFRTAPVGALGPTAALWEASQIMIGPVGQSLALGLGIGTAIAPILRDYTLNLYDAIGGTINQVIENMSERFNSPDKATRADGQKSSLNTFAVPDSVQMALGESRGDYDVAADFSDVFYGGGSGCSIRELFCDIQQA